MKKPLVNAEIKVGIVIVNFFSEKYITDLLSSLDDKRSDSFEVVIVSNSGPMDSIDTCRYSFKIKIILSDKNIGFGRACNLGVKNLDTKYILFLNPDVLITHEIVDKLFEIHEENPESGAIKPIVGGERIIIKPPFELKSIRHLNIGSTFMIRRDFFHHLGGFDENFFLWFEDTDLRDRILNNNRKIYMVNNIVLSHVSMHSTYHVNKGLAIFLVKAWICSHVHYLIKNKGILTGMGWCIGKIIKSLFLLIFKKHPEAPHLKHPGAAILFSLMLLVRFYRIKANVKFDGEKYTWGGKPPVPNR
jgi:GT2 family glycosyltransferase